MQLVHRKESFNIHEMFGDLMFNALVLTLLFVTVLSLLVNGRINEESAAVTKLASASELNLKLKTENQTLISGADAVRAENRQLQQQVTAAREARRNRRIIGSATLPQFFFLQHVSEDGTTKFVPVAAVHGLRASLSGTDDQKQLNQNQMDLLKKVEKDCFVGARKYTTSEFTRLLSALSFYRREVHSREGVLIRTEQGIVGGVHLEVCSRYVSNVMSKQTGKYFTFESAVNIRRQIDSVDRMRKLCHPTPRPAKGRTPTLACIVSRDREAVSVGGVSLSASDFYHFLSALSGVVELDFQDDHTNLPEWLHRKVLNRTGFSFRADREAERAETT